MYVTTKADRAKTKALKKYAPQIKEATEHLAEYFGVSVDEFQSTAGVSPSSFYGLACSGKMPQLRHFIMIADHYGLTIDELLDRRI